MRKPKPDASWPESPYLDAVQDLLADRNDREARRAIAGMLEEEGPREVFSSISTPRWFVLAVLRFHRRLPGDHPDRSYDHRTSGWEINDMIRRWWDRFGDELRDELKRQDPTRAWFRPASVDFDHDGVAWAAGGRRCFVNEPYARPEDMLLQAEWIEDLIWPYGFTLVLPVGNHNQKRTPRLIALPLQPVPSKRAEQESARGGQAQKGR